MATEARVRSIEELEAFRAALIVFIAKAKKAVDQAGEEVRRTRLWIDSDRRPFWEGQVKKRLRLLEQAQQELLSARMSEFVDSPVVQQQAVRKAKLALQEAEEKLARVKHWSRSFEAAVSPMAKKLESATQFIDFDLPQAVAHLANLIRLLDDYADRNQPVTLNPQPGSTEPSTPEPSA